MFLLVFVKDFDVPICDKQVPGYGLPIVTLSEGKPQPQFCNIFHVNFVSAPIYVLKPYFCIIYWYNDTTTDTPNQVWYT